MFPGSSLQGGTSSMLQGGSGMSLQGSTRNPQRTLSVGRVQPAAPIPMVGSTGQGGQNRLGATTAVADNGAAALAAQQAAANAAQVAGLRDEVTNLANNIKSIFNSRYGQVDSAVKEQTGRLNERFGTESSDINTQVEGENQALGAAHAASGSYDSSYRGNNVDTVTQAGENQIRDLGTELKENLGEIGGWASRTKQGFNAQKEGMDNILARLAESTDVNELTSIRNSLESRITELRGGDADNNTSAQNLSALERIAPSSVRAQQLKTTLSQVVGGSADAGTKLAIAKRLVQSAQLTPQEQTELLNGVQTDLEKQQQQ